MTTAAKPITKAEGHWYYPTGQPCYEVPYADPRKGNRPTTLADARKLGLLPSVTTIMRVLHRQGLVNFWIEQACLAVLTSPRLENEELDAFVDRILNVERVQEQEADVAKNRGTEMHGALEDAVSGRPFDAALNPWIRPAFEEICKRGKTIGTETIVVGNGYGGKLDLVQETTREIWLWDWKTSKKLPNPDKGGAWTEHKLQLAAYAKAWARGDKPIRTGNVYISTVEPGAFCVCEHEDWQAVYEQGFKPLVQLWQFMNGYTPAQL